MAGVPWHSVESYLQSMLRAGYKVTMCEQEEELRPGSKILERVVTRVYTPGSLYEENLSPPSILPVFLRGFSQELHYFFHFTRGIRS